ncbi:hypothetical protein [Paenibacillus sp. FSL W8-0194]|uniref:hypothetical protein n=1 Tax=Paenibacillus sp. FSL W8-0194 TaxID=2921711 RepID=UPI0030D95975
MEPPAGNTSAEESDELSDYEKGIMGEGTTQEGSDLPEWMQGDAQSLKDQEMSFEDTDQESEDEASAAAEDSQNSGDVEITPEELEQYILSQRPSFPDLQLDFSRLFERKGRTG